VSSALSDDNPLRHFLARHGVDAEIIDPGRPAPTVESAAEALGVDAGQIIKSLLFEGDDGRVVLVIARGTQKVDRKKVADASGLRKPRLASAARVLNITGYEAGGTPPVGHRTPVPVLIDSAVLDEPVVYGGGGRVDLLLRIRSEDIRRLTRASVADLSAID
jgi:Cys-tRNA(Pro) deacylase